MSYFHIPTSSFIYFVMKLKTHLRKSEIKKHLVLTHLYYMSCTSMTVMQVCIHYIGPSTKYVSVQVSKHQG